MKKLSEMTISEMLESAKDGNKFYDLELPIKEP